MYVTIHLLDINKTKLPPFSSWSLKIYDSHCYILEEEEEEEGVAMWSDGGVAIRGKNCYY